MSGQRPERIHHYRNHAMDSARWEGFDPRPGDIHVCTSYKAGTTWTQTVCAQLIFQQQPWPEQLSRLSPWMEMFARPADEVHRMYAAQSHRRFIKSHTPLDGIPFFDDAVYLVCARDPRDVFMSLRNHFDNTDFAAVQALRKGVGLPPLEITPPDEPQPPDELFKLWLTVPMFEWEQDGFPMWSFFNHIDSFWRYRHLPNIHFLHYADLEADLEGQMRRLAGLLDIEVDEALLPKLVAGARFDAVQARPERFAPEADLGVWKDNARFFNKGTSGQYRGALSDESLALYDRVKVERVGADVARWLERGSLACGDPKDFAG